MVEHVRVFDRLQVLIVDELAELFRIEAGLIHEVLISLISRINRLLLTLRRGLSNNQLRRGRRITLNLGDLPFCLGLGQVNLSPVRGCLLLLLLGSFLLRSNLSLDERVLTDFAQLNLDDLQ